MELDKVKEFKIKNKNSDKLNNTRDKKRKDWREIIKRRKNAANEKTDDGW